MVALFSNRSKSSEALPIQCGSAQRCSCLSSFVKVKFFAKKYCSSLLDRSTLSDILPIQRGYAQPYSYLFSCVQASFLRSLTAPSSNLSTYSDAHHRIRDERSPLYWHTTQTNTGCTVQLSLSVYIGLRTGDWDNHRRMRGLHSMAVGTQYRRIQWCSSLSRSITISTNTVVQLSVHIDHNMYEYNGAALCPDSSLSRSITIFTNTVVQLFVRNLSITICTSAVMQLFVHINLLTDSDTRPVGPSRVSDFCVATASNAAAGIEVSFF